MEWTTSNPDSTSLSEVGPLNLFLQDVNYFPCKKRLRGQIHLGNAGQIFWRWFIYCRTFQKVQDAHVHCLCLRRKDGMLSQIIHFLKIFFTKHPWNYHSKENTMGNAVSCSHRLVDTNHCYISRRYIYLFFQGKYPELQENQP